MRLQKQSVGEIRGREYSKYVVIIPNECINRLEWQEGEELEPEIREQSLIIHKSGFKAKPASAVGTRLIAKHSKAK